MAEGEGANPSLRSGEMWQRDPEQGPNTKMSGSTESQWSAEEKAPYKWETPMDFKDIEKATRVCIENVTNQKEKGVHSTISGVPLSAWI